MSLQNLFGETVIDNQGNTYKVSDTLEKCQRIGIYFSAHWYRDPCFTNSFQVRSMQVSRKCLLIDRKFTPELVKTYNELKQSGAAFDIVFVSSDRNEKQFNEYFSEMPWKAVTDKNIKANLQSKYKLKGIPTLIIIDNQGNTISVDGRTLVNADPSGKSLLA
jgi:nucleoredoxin